MTYLRFVGSLPWWLGLLLAVLAAVLSWLYYRRESFELSRLMRWVLPGLRSLAFFLGVMILTGPVLHHRKVIGELGDVKILIDLSESMNSFDAQMSTGRKLMVAEQLGWIREGVIDTDPITVAQALMQLRREMQSFLDSRKAAGSSADSDSAEGSAWQKTVSEFRSKLAGLEMTEDLGERFRQRVLEPLEQVADSDSAQLDQRMAQVIAECRSVESSLEDRFQASIDQLVESGDGSINAALSMFDKTSRWKRIETGLSQGPAKILKSLQEHHQIQIFGLQGSQLKELVLDDSDGVRLNLAAVVGKSGFSSATDLGTGLLQYTGSGNDSTESETTLTQRSAFVLLTDGRHNHGASPQKPSQLLAAQGVRVFPVAVGANKPAPDLAVVKMEYPDPVFQKDRIRGTIQVRESLPANSPYVAQIRSDDTVLWQKQMTAIGQGDRKIDFDFGIDELVTGLKITDESEVKHHALPIPLEASISPVNLETDITNNSRSVLMSVILQRHRVLILDGRSRWETRYIRNAFDRDEQWDVNSITVTRGAEPSIPRGEKSGEFPETKRELLQYDLILFGELEADLLTDDEYQWLEEFVSIRGGGLILLDGLRGKLRENEKPQMKKLIPVDWEEKEIESLPGPFRLTESGAAEASLKLTSRQEDNAEFWKVLPAPHQLVPVTALEDATVLVETEINDQPWPALVSRRAGAGKVLYLAFDETWRWRFEHADKWHQRAWNQLAKFAMPTPYAVSDEYVAIDSGGASFQVGDPIRIRTRLTGLDGKPNPNSLVDALVYRNGELVDTIHLDGDAAIEGVYLGAAEDLAAGNYEIRIRASGYPESALKAKGRFSVMTTDTGEQLETSTNERLLREIAEMTGGEFLREEQLNELPELLRPLSQGRVVNSETPIWQSYWWFSVMILLLAIEWALRKRAGLL